MVLVRLVLNVFSGYQQFIIEIPLNLSYKRNLNYVHKAFIRILFAFFLFQLVFNFSMFFSMAHVVQRDLK